LIGLNTLVMPILQWLFGMTNVFSTEQGGFQGDAWLVVK